jgi:hypothetical protein
VRRVEIRQRDWTSRNTAKFTAACHKLSDAIILAPIIAIDAPYPAFLGFKIVLEGNQLVYASINHFLGDFNFAVPFRRGCRVGNARVF